MTPVWIWIKREGIDVCRYITLNARISIDEPGAAKIVSRFQNFVLDEVLQFRVLMLELVSKQQPRESRADGHHFQFSLRRECRGILECIRVIVLKVCQIS